MSSYSLIVRLPSGTEYWYAAKTPDVGDTILRRGKRYVVTACEQSDDERLVVTLEEAPLAASRVPVPPAAA